MSHIWFLKLFLEFLIFQSSRCLEFLSVKLIRETTQNMRINSTEWKTIENVDSAIQCYILCKYEGTNCFAYSVSRAQRKCRLYYVHPCGRQYTADGDWKSFVMTSIDDYTEHVLNTRCPCIYNSTCSGNKTFDCKVSHNFVANCTCNDTNYYGSHCTNRDGGWCNYVQSCQSWSDCKMDNGCCWRRHKYCTNTRKCECPTPAGNGLQCSGSSSYQSHQHTGRHNSNCVFRSCC